MNRLILIAIFFTLLISSEVLITALVTQSFDICMTDTAADGESEKDTEEKSEDDNKIEILVINNCEEGNVFSKSPVHSEKSTFSRPYLALATLPPEI